MSIFTTLLTGTSGLSAHGDAIDVVGDNIANVSTIGFKESRAQFSDVIGGQFANGQSQGQGVRMNGSETLFGQGAMQSTGRALDLGINGNGFFVVAGKYAGQQGQFYSRDGRIALDNSGTLVNAEGLKLQGYTIDPTGKMSAAAGDLVVGGQSAPNATTKASMQLNLDSTSVVPAAFNPANPSGTSNYSTSMTVYDSLGAPHRADVYFRNQGGGGWEWHAMVDGGELTGGTPGTPTEIATGTLTFDTAGNMTASATTSSSASFVGATANQAIAFDFTGTSAYASASTVNALSQDGYGAGSLSDLAISSDGTITGKFSNGQSRDIARVALADFASDQGLHRVGSQLFSATDKSGAALVDAASTGGRGSISSGSLETSNVDLASELVTLIAYQRAFSANSKTVQTADEMLQEVSNLKR